MIEKLILLSGPVSSGKTLLASNLKEITGGTVVKTHDLIEEVDRTVERSRRAFQEAGQRLDRKTNGQWIAKALAQKYSSEDDSCTIIVDAVRIKSQVRHIRKAFGSKVTHIHLTASDDELEGRYKKKNSDIRELPSYAEVKQNSTERNIRNLSKIADLYIDTDRSLPQDILVRSASYLGLYGATFYKNVDVLVGGQYGSEGKGQIAAFLSKEYDILVRVGGPNAGHKVWAEPEPFTYHHLPSGTDTSNAVLVIGPGAVLRVQDLLNEIAASEVTPDRLSIDPQAMIIEKEDEENEEELKNSIGSTGRGVGSATARKVLRSIAKPKVQLAKDNPKLGPYIKETRKIFERAYSDGKKILLEGTQGTGLSLHHGNYPHVTSRDTTVAGCLAEAGLSASRVRKIIMVCRTYPIRVESPKEGTSGYMSQEISMAAIAERSGVDFDEIKRTETTSTTGKSRRVSEFDWNLLREASVLNSPTDIALTFVDYLSVRNRDARRFDQLATPTIHFVEEVERVASAPVSLIATRFHARSVIDRRIW